MTSLAGLALAACAPGQTPTDRPLTALLTPVTLNTGNTPALKRLIFEAQTLLCNEVKLKANRRDDASQTAFAGLETNARVQQQRVRLSGLRFRGEEERSHSSYDLVLSILEKNCLTYLGPDKFPTRPSELMQEKPNKEISIDQSQFVVKDKQLDVMCPTVTEGNFQRIQTPCLGVRLGRCVHLSCDGSIPCRFVRPSSLALSTRLLIRISASNFESRLGYNTLKRHAANELPLANFAHNFQPTDGRLPLVAVGRDLHTKGCNFGQTSVA